MCFSMPFLTTPSAPMTTGTVIVFNPHIFIISISRSLYLDSFSATFTDVFRSEGICHIYQHACLFLIIFNNDVRFISFDRFIGVYLHIPENGNFFIFCNSFWLVLVPLIYGSREGTIQKYFANPKKYFKSQYYSQITVEKFDKSKKLLQILRNFVDPQITFSIIRKYFANP